MEKMIRPCELQQVLGLGKSVIYRMLATGEIPCVIVTNGRRRRSFRVRPADLERWMRGREVTNARSN